MVLTLRRLSFRIGPDGEAHVFDVPLRDVIHLPAAPPESLLPFQFIPVSKRQRRRWARAGLHNRWGARRVPEPVPLSERSVRLEMRTEVLRAHRIERCMMRRVPRPAFSFCAGVEQWEEVREEAVLYLPDGVEPSPAHLAAVERAMGPMQV